MRGMKTQRYFDKGKKEFIFFSLDLLIQRDK